MAERRFGLTIFTHEAANFPFEQTIVELLTQFCVGVGAPLQTYILTEDLGRFGHDGSDGNELTLVHEDHYKKVDVEKTKMFAGKRSEVVFMSCHGFGRGTEPATPAGLTFRCHHNNMNQHEGAKQTVWARDPGGDYDPKDKVTLHELVQNCRLAVVLGCHGDALIEDYLQARGRKDLFPDMLICNGDVWGASMQIFMILLIHILDSEMNVAGPPADDAVYLAFRNAITKIFQIVKVFALDHLGFWTFLETIGCVTENYAEKYKQQMTYPSERLGATPRFRIYGSVFTYEFGNCEYVVAQDLQKLELVTFSGEAEPLRQNYKSVPSIRISDDTNIDRYLRRWIRERTPVPAASLAAGTHTQLRGLLEKLQRLQY